MKPILLSAIAAATLLAATPSLAIGLSPFVEVPSFPTDTVQADRGCATPVGTTTCTAKPAR